MKMITLEKLRDSLRDLKHEVTVEPEIAARAAARSNAWSRSPSLMPVAKLTPEQAQLLLDPNYAVVATLREDGGPQATVWIDWDGENAVFNTTTVRAKGQHLAREPRSASPSSTATTPTAR